MPSEQKIPRPKNAFILFRQHYHKILINEWTAKNIAIPHNSEISKLLGNKWKLISAKEKLHWDNLAKQEKINHEKKFPQYKYRPVRKQKKKFLQLQQQIQQQQQAQQQLQHHVQQQLQQQQQQQSVGQQQIQAQAHHQLSRGGNGRVQYYQTLSNNSQNSNLTGIPSSIENEQKLLYSSSIPNSINFNDPTTQLQAQNFYYQQKSGMSNSGNPNNINLLLPSIDTTKLMNQQSFLAQPSGTPAATQTQQMMDHFYKI
ncbi:similar to Saccharomyces cerevisiae YPR065W ROX1 Heme-dependent repressor of hypoxic genes [Maudiozyma saulgeensis]|uniref:Similar to Saccharomyces cerevisiae YPR065W ROX1 Heme-dependent repressor of hypoxic genes n=1 Tax=Maudiozyma saulgeensis TaxID=1789683 RepID=A0A1X7QY70_9SACH|nr:similar to Saccharomyces cerevisiae YPR065W ROX1 Heme-dependent repressor of hypoxic genes [Kazachstania saulgeensis]